MVREYASKEETINQALNEAKDHAMLSGRKKSQVEGTMSEKVLKVAHQRTSDRFVIYFHALYLILALILVVIKKTFICIICSLLFKTVSSNDMGQELSPFCAHH